MYYLYTVVFAAATVPEDKLGWVMQRGFLAVFPTFIYIWGAMRAFDTSTRAEDPMAGVESDTWKKFRTHTDNSAVVLWFLAPF